MELIRNIFKSLKKNKKRKQVIILDVCALKTQKAMDIIEESSKVVLLLGTISELDDNKKIVDPQGKNIRTILKASREDSESKKYLCVSGYEKYPYVDDNIIEYCRKNREVTILTCDNGLCNKAKAFGISYIFAEDEPKIYENNTKNLNSTQANSINPKSELTTNKETEKEQSLLEVELSENSIKILTKKGWYVHYVVVREKRIINSRNYQAGDELYIYKYNNKTKNMSILVYDIEKTNHGYMAYKRKEYPIRYINDIYVLNLPEELEEDIRKFYLQNKDY